MNLYEKLIKVQSELKAPKSQYNSFGKYSYRTCEDILNALKPLCLEVGAVVVVNDEIELIGDRYYIKATAKFIDVESSEEICNTAFARESRDKKGMDDSQITGSTSSYARKYALNGLFAIDDTKDADSTNTGDDDNTNSAPSPQPPTRGRDRSESTEAPTGRRRAR
ncbi:MAG: ERF family protein [Sarcina sp.]